MTAAPTPPDTALACLDEGERELVTAIEYATQRGLVGNLDGSDYAPLCALIRRLACELDDAKDGAEVLHEEIAKYRAQLSQRDAEIAELKGRIAARDRDVLDLAEDVRTLVGFLARNPDWCGAPFVMNEATNKALAALEDR